jgi:hypothetical protein
MAAMNEAGMIPAGIVGGGTGGSGLLSFLFNSKKIRVSFVVDQNPEAPGLKAAAQAGIPTFTDMHEAFRKVPVQLIFDMTGVPPVKAQILEFMKGSDIQYMPIATWMLIQELDAAKKEAAGKVVQEFSSIREHLTSSQEASQNLVNRINSIMSSMQMLALNASIEAAKVGVHGRGFAVVAEHMTKSVENVRKLTEDIAKVNGDLQTVAGQINTAISHLE